MKLVITDCDHDAITEECEVADRYGASLVRADAHSPEQIVAACQDADGILVQYAQITDEVMARLPRLRVIGRYGVGVDTVDIAAATRRRIAVCNVPDYGTESVCDHALALAVALVRQVGLADKRVRQGQPELDALRPIHLYHELTFGVLGCGRIGTATARKARALGFRVQVCDLLATGDRWHDLPAVGLDQLFTGSDIVSVHTPLNDSTHHLVNAARLAQMRPTGYLVNTSRGPVVDTDALIAAIDSGALAGAGLDVHETEPLPADSPLLTMDRVLLTPHIAWYSEQTYGELKRRTAENVAEYLSGRRPRDLYNPDVLSQEGLPR